MTELDSYLIIVGIILTYFLFGVFLGKSMDNSKVKKNWIVSFFDGYLIVLPFGLMMTGLGLFLPLYGAVMLIYSLIKFIMGEFVLNDYTAAGLAFGVFACVFCFWWWFRSKVLGKENII